MSIVCRILQVAGIAAIALIAVGVIGYVVLLNIDPNRERPARIGDPTGFVRAVGTNLYDGAGRLLRLRGG